MDSLIDFLRIFFAMSIPLTVGFYLKSFFPNSSKDWQKECKSLRAELNRKDELIDKALLCVQDIERRLESGEITYREAKTEVVKTKNGLFYIRGNQTVWFPAKVETEKETATKSESLKDYEAYSWIDD